MKRLLASFLVNQRGTAAIEFALVVPLLLTLTLGMFEFAGLATANIKFTNAAQLLGDLVAQQLTVTHAMMSNFCTGSQYTLSPLSTTSLTATVASVTNYSTGIAVDWQDTTCGGTPIGNAVSLASALIPNVNDSVIVVVANYSYTSPVAFVLSSSYPLTQTTFSRPRNVTSTQPSITYN